jgi:hypothetical protein
LGLKIYHLATLGQPRLPTLTAKKKITPIPKKIVVVYFDFLLAMLLFKSIHKQST